MIPAAPTSARRCFSGKAEAADASTNGTGTSSSRLMPVSRTSPPQAFTVSPWPSSCTILTSGYMIHMSSRNSGVSMWTEAKARIGAQLVPADNRPSSTTTTHAASDTGCTSARPSGANRSSSLSGSNSVTRNASGLSMAMRRLRFFSKRRRNSSATLGVISHCSRSLSLSWQRISMVSSWVGVFSPSLLSSECQISSVERLPSIRPMKWKVFSSTR